MSPPQPGEGDQNYHPSFPSPAACQCSPETLVMAKRIMDLACLRLEKQRKAQPTHFLEPQ